MCPWASLGCFFLLYFSCSFIWVAGTHESNSVFLEGRKRLHFSISSQPPVITILTYPGGKGWLHKLLISEENREETIISPYILMWQHIPRDSDQALLPISQHILSGDAKVERIFPAYQVLRGEMFVPACFRQLQSQEWCF